MALFYLVFLNCVGGDFFPLVVLFDTVTLNAVISLFFGLFKQFITKYIFVYGNTINS